jgi:hypothetical protein
MLLNAFIRRDHLVLRLLLVIALTGAGNTQTQSSAASSAAAVVTLSPSASPSTAQPGTILVNLTGSNFPSGTISPADVTVTLVPAIAGSGPTLSVVASAVTTIVGTTVSGAERCSGWKRPHGKDHGGRRPPGSGQHNGQLRRGSLSRRRALGRLGTGECPQSDDCHRSIGN